MSEKEIIKALLGRIQQTLQDIFKESDNAE